MRTKLSEDELLELNRRVVERPPRAAAVSRVSAEWAAIRKGIRRAEIVALSLFTTQSSSSAVEQIHRQIAASSVAPATFNIGPEGSRAYFPMNSVRSLAFDSQQTTDAGWVRIPTNMAPDSVSARHLEAQLLCLA